MQFREAPFEWVYDGLRPLLIHDVLQSTKGMGASLAIIYCCVGRRLGMDMIPLHLQTGWQLFFTQWHTESLNSNASDGALTGIMHFASVWNVIGLDQCAMVSQEQLGA